MPLPLRPQPVRILRRAPNAPFATRIQSIRCCTCAVTCACVTSARFSSGAALAAVTVHCVGPLFGTSFAHISRKIWFVCGASREAHFAVMIMMMKMRWKGSIMRACVALVIILIMSKWCWWTNEREQKKEKDRSHVEMLLYGLCCSHRKDLHGWCETMFGIQRSRVFQNAKRKSICTIHIQHTHTYNIHIKFSNVHPTQQQITEYELSTQTHRLLCSTLTKANTNMQISPRSTRPWLQIKIRQQYNI